MKRRYRKYIRMRKRARVGCIISRILIALSMIAAVGTAGSMDFEAVSGAARTSLSIFVLRMLIILIIGVLSFWFSCKSLSDFDDANAWLDKYGKII